MLVALTCDTLKILAEKLINPPNASLSARNPGFSCDEDLSL